MLASFPASMLNQKPSDLGILNRFKLDPSRSSREHSPIDGTYPWARKEISIGFTGTYNDEGADFDATALAGKRSFRFKSIYQLLFAD